MNTLTIKIGIAKKMNARLVLQTNHFVHAYITIQKIIHMLFEQFDMLFETLMPFLVHSWACT